MKRAIDNEQKEIRRCAILDSALCLFEETDGSLSTVAAIAKRSGIAKGTIYLYFKTREEIYLALLDIFINQWFDLIDDIDNKQAGSIAEFVDIACGYIEKNPVFMKLASIFNGILEKNIDYDTAYRFKANLRQRVLSSSLVLSNVIPGISRDLAIHLLLRSFALSIGMWQIAEPAPILKKVLEEKELTLLKIDFLTELKESLKHLWEGALNDYLKNSL